MTWGPMFMFYRCPECGYSFKYDLDLLGALGDNFGKCPACGAQGEFVKDGPRNNDSEEYEDAE